jgi:hypothetical protein
MLAPCPVGVDELGIINLGHVVDVLAADAVFE